MNINEFMDERIDDVINQYFDIKLKNFQTPIDFTVWSNDYVTKIKRLGYFKSSETFEFFDLLKEIK